MQTLARAAGAGAICGTGAGQTSDCTECDESRSMPVIIETAGAASKEKLQGKIRLLGKGDRGGNRETIRLWYLGPGAR